MTSMKQNAAYHGAGIIFWTVDEQGIVTVLMGKRSVSPQKHRWSFPGGGWEHTDGFAANGSVSYETAVLREASEEMGITDIRKEQLVPLWSLDISFFHYRVFSCQLDAQMQTPYLSEFSDALWAPLSNPPCPLVLFVATQLRNLQHMMVRPCKISLQCACCKSKESTQ